MTRARKTEDPWDRTHLRALVPTLKEILISIPGRPDFQVVPVLQVSKTGSVLVDLGGEGSGAVRWIPESWIVIE